jgi:hypothetical protein
MAFADADKALKELMVDQQVDQRSFNFLSPLVMLGNVLGHKPRRSIDQWIGEKDNRFVFDGVTSRIKVANTTSHQKATLKDQSITDDNDVFKIKGHQHIKTLSVINENLWSGGVWRGFAFFVDPNPHTIHSPTLYLMFDDRQTAIDIFKEWNERFGDKVGQKIKISILKGIDVDNPYWYKGLISSNINKEEMRNGNTIILTTKISTMTPTAPRNLEGFLESYSRFGYFTLAPFYIDLNSGKPEPLDEFGFVMKELSVRNAWEVAINELEMAAISSVDKPIIPKGIKNAPVLEVLKMKSARQENG